MSECASACGAEVSHRHHLGFYGFEHHVMDMSIHDRAIEYSPAEIMIVKHIDVCSTPTVPPFLPSSQMLETYNFYHLCIGPIKSDVEGVVLLAP